jgi:putative GTP pyrophosphokinase
MLPSSDLTKNQVDRLGDRLRKGDISDDDLRLLDSYRRSFTDAYEEIVSRIRDQRGLEPTGRPAKSTTSIIEKLRRESIRLSQVQDIAGCRVVVSDIAAQDSVVLGFKNLFGKSAVFDRRDHPSHGYRAVHVIVESRAKLIEIQVRTSLQHLWAEVSEKLSDVVDTAIKYGGGGGDIPLFLRTASEEIILVESAEDELRKILAAANKRQHELSDDMSRKISEARELLGSRKQDVVKLLNLLGEVAPLLKRRMLKGTER